MGHLGSDYFEFICVLKTPEQCPTVLEKVTGRKPIGHDILEIHLYDSWPVLMERKNEGIGVPMKYRPFSFTVLMSH